MARLPAQEADPELDLVLERVIAVPRHLVWAAWTQPELLKKWFTPDPWQTVDCTIDLQPGGAFRTVMRGPEAQEFDNTGCYLQVVENEMLAWTGALGPGFRPLSADVASAVPFVMSAVITLQTVDGGTQYTALVKHGDAGAREKHEQMRFHEGWGKALDQLVALMAPRAG